MTYTAEFIANNIEQLLSTLRLTMDENEEWQNLHMLFDFGFQSWTSGADIVSQLVGIDPSEIKTSVQSKLSLPWVATNVHLLWPTQTVPDQISQRNEFFNMAAAHWPCTGMPCTEARAPLRPPILRQHGFGPHLNFV